MSEKSLNEVTHKVHRAEVVQHDGKLMIPHDMEIDDAIGLLVELRDSLEQTVELQREYDAFPWDGALALQRVLKDRYGWVPSKPRSGLFMKRPPRTVSVEVGYKQIEQVPWGTFGLPGIVGEITTSVQNKSGRLVFSLSAEVVRKHEPVVKAIFDEVAAQLDKGSIYLGQAISVRFRDDDGDAYPIPTVSFLDASVTKENLILSSDLEDIVETNLFTPIRRTQDCLANGVPVKRGVLLGGPYGTGKTLAAAVAANEAVAHGVTYLYVPRADELASAIKFARQYADPACVVFCEDIDRVMNGERDVDMDDLLNIIDGIDGKDTNIIVVLTTNFLEEINQAMLRPGRLDAVIEVSPPDAEAVQRLLRHYAGEAVRPDTDLSKVGDLLKGNIPAIIAEVVKRAKLSELRRTPDGSMVEGLSEDALVEAAKTMRRQLDLLEERHPEAVPSLDRAMREIVEGRAA